MQHKIFCKIGIASKTKRHKDSAVHLQNLLNKDHIENIQTLMRLFDNESFISYEKRQMIEPKIRVNCISNVDVIT